MAIWKDADGNNFLADFNLVSTLAGEAQPDTAQVDLRWSIVIDPHTEAPSVEIPVVSGEQKFSSLLLERRENGELHGTLRHARGWEVPLGEAFAEPFCAYCKSGVTTVPVSPEQIVPMYGREITFQMSKLRNMRIADDCGFLHDGFVQILTGAQKEPADRGTPQSYVNMAPDARCPVVVCQQLLPNGALGAKATFDLSRNDGETAIVVTDAWGHTTTFPNDYNNEHAADIPAFAYRYAVSARGQDGERVLPPWDAIPELIKVAGRDKVGLFEDERGPFVGVGLSDARMLLVVQEQGGVRGALYNGEQLESEFQGQNIGEILKQVEDRLVPDQGQEAEE
jgi:hypothetical protein